MIKSWFSKALLLKSKKKALMWYMDNLFFWLSYSYTTVRVWYRSNYTSTRRSRARVLITMISYEYTWYNWLVPCQRNWNQLCFKDLLYFAKKDRYTLLEQSGNWLFYWSILIYAIQTSLFVPHAAIHVLYLYTIKLTAENTNWGTNNEGMRVIRWHNYSSLAPSNCSL